MMKIFNRQQLSHLDNGRVLDYLDRGARSGGQVHPDIEIRMQELDKTLPSYELGQYEHTLVLVNPETMQVVAAAFGTAYSIRAGDRLSDAIEAGARQYRKWSDGSALEYSDFGPDWVDGGWHADESQWIQSVVS